MSRLGDGVAPNGGGPGSTPSVTTRPGDSGAFAGLGGRSPVGLATVNAFLEATANVSTATARESNAYVGRARAGDEAEAIRAISESMLALAVSAGDTNCDEASTQSTKSPSPASNTSPHQSPFRAPDASGVRLATSRLEPGAVVVFRTREARERNPTRLDLDRRGLSEMCLLEGEHRLRLLNYAHNRVTKVTRLDGVCGGLVFLDLTGNKLESLCGVEACVNLRVLLVGKNKMRRLGNALSSLRRLDVLDAHDNSLDTLGDTETVFGESKRSLRVLNLSGNNLCTTGDLRLCQCLAEIDLRRNRIVDLATREENGRDAWCGLPKTALKKCWLSGNPLATKHSWAPLTQMPKLEAVALDGTPWCTMFGPNREAYRDATLAEMNQLTLLRTLDGEAVTKKGGTSFPESASREVAFGSPPLVFGPGKSASPPRKQNVVGVSVSEPFRDSKRLETKLGVAFDAQTRALTVHSRFDTEATLTDHPGASLARRVVFAEGVFSDFADFAKQETPSAPTPRNIHNTATTRLVRCLTWARHASSHATALEFRDSGMGSLALVDAVARAGWGETTVSVPRSEGDTSLKSAERIESLRVVSAPNGTPGAFFRAYAIHKFSSLAFIDDIAVTKELRARAGVTFGGADDDATIGAFYRGTRLEKSDGAGAGAEETPALLDGVKEHAPDVATKLSALEKCWDKIVRSYVEEGLRDEG